MSSRRAFVPTCSFIQVTLQHCSAIFIYGSGILEDFAGIDQSNPNCVVVGDAEDEFTYERMNTAFRILMSSERPLLITLGVGYAQNIGSVFGNQSASESSTSGWTVRASMSALMRRLWSTPRTAR